MKSLNFLIIEKYSRTFDFWDFSTIFEIFEALAKAGIFSRLPRNRCRNLDRDGSPHPPRVPHRRNSSQYQRRLRCPDQAAELSLSAALVHDVVLLSA